MAFCASACIRPDFVGFPRDFGGFRIPRARALQAAARCARIWPCPAESAGAVARGRGGSVSIREWSTTLKQPQGLQRIADSRSQARTRNTVRLGPEQTVYALTGEVKYSQEILDNLLKVMAEAELFVPRTKDELFAVMGRLKTATQKARAYKVADALIRQTKKGAAKAAPGFVGGPDEAHAYC